jgi:tetratricopeptide (TPR) repeat protein
VTRLEEMATAADDARFEVLEEETHYPASHPKSAAAAAAAAAASEDEQKREQQAEETLEAQLARLVLDAQEGDHADAAAATRAKELGNKFFGGGRFLDAIESYTTALKLCPSEDESLAHDRVRCPYPSVCRRRDSDHSDARSYACARRPCTSATAPRVCSSW